MARPNIINLTLEDLGPEAECIETYISAVEHKCEEIENKYNQLYQLHRKVTQIILPVTVRGEKGTQEPLIVFANTAVSSGGEINFECFNFTEGHGQVSAKYYKQFTYTLTGDRAVDALARMQKYYDSIDDQPVKLKHVHQLTHTNNQKAIT